MTSKSKQTLLCVVSAVLALALVFSLIRLHNYKNSAKELYSRMQIENAYLFTRDVFLKGDRQTREDNYLYSSNMPIAGALIPKTKIGEQSGV